MGMIVARICGFVKRSPWVRVEIAFALTHDNVGEYDEYE
jgi:hypothetical protein